MLDIAEIYCRLGGEGEVGVKFVVALAFLVAGSIPTRAVFFGLFVWYDLMGYSSFFCKLDSAN